MKIKEVINKQNVFIVLFIVFMCTVILFFQIKKVGFHEDEGYTLSSAVNMRNGLMSAYEGENGSTSETPIWKTREYVKEYMTLTSDNYLNLSGVFRNQMYDNHPPVFYALVHFSSILFGGEFSKYTVFVVNIIAFILSCFVIKQIFKIINKENLIYATLLLYGLSMGTISMVLFQRMYMLLTLFSILYLYYNIKIYKNDFKITKGDILKLGLITVLGFLTQYFFAVYAVAIFAMMIVKMVREKKTEHLKKYIIAHMVYGIIGIVLFPPCLYHLVFSDRGLKNLGNSSYLKNLDTYIRHLGYAFSIKSSTLILFVFLVMLFIRITRLHDKKEERFIVLLLSLPTVIFFLITVKMTSYQELRYIMPILPFVAIILYVVLDTLIDIEYKNLMFLGISVVLVVHGLIFSKPRFLYENYQDILTIAKENSEKPFIYIYDNFFNHMQSVPEMMIYQKTLIINANKEIEYLLTNEELNKEESYILSIKGYMNNEEILERIQKETEFKNITSLYQYSKNNLPTQVENNLYLVSK